MLLTSRLATPIGDLHLTGDGEALTAVRFDGAGTGVRDDAALAGARDQLEAWFAGERTAFDLPLRPGGTPFQQRVWAAVRAVPYGTTSTYGALAAQLGTAPRAVGLANGRNPLSIVVPCHRLLGASGALTGYAGGLERKRALLDLEQRYVQRSGRTGSAMALRSEANATAPMISGSQNRISR